MKKAIAHLKIPQQELAQICRRWKIIELDLCGSVLQDTFTPESDVDILISFDTGARWGLFDLVRLQDELQNLLGRKVDLVERKAIESSENYIRRKHILSSLEPIYVER